MQCHSSSIKAIPTSVDLTQSQHAECYCASGQTATSHVSNLSLYKHLQDSIQYLYEVTLSGDEVSPGP